MDLNARYRKQLPVDSQSMRDLPDDQKHVAISYPVNSGELVPADTRMIWPYACRKRSASENLLDSLGAG